MSILARIEIRIDKLRELAKAWDDETNRFVCYCEVCTFVRSEDFEETVEGSYE